MTEERKEEHQQGQGKTRPFGRPKRKRVRVITEGSNVHLIEEEEEIE